MTKLHELNKIGQSVWYDNIRRSLIEDGGLQALIDAGVVGITSNPSIFEKAIAGSDDYDKTLQQLVAEGKAAEEIFEALAIEDIQRAADLLYPVYEETDGLDGYVSLEVNPNLALDTEGTVAEARRLFNAVGRPNAMIKVPGTAEGIPAVETLIGDGININITLLFSNDNYQQVVEAYMRGLENLAADDGDLSRVASVASFFVSRVDTAVDKALEAAGNSDLQGKIAIANAKIAYTIYEEIIASERWQGLAAKGARPQRLLWASTSTKNPSYPDTLYVDELIGASTVNTMPESTLEAFRDHGRVEITLTVNVDEARAQLARLEEVGIDIDAITDKLQEDGVRAFADAFTSLIESIEEKREQLRSEAPPPEVDLSEEANGGDQAALVEAALQEMRQADIMARIGAHDFAVWQPEPTEITNRLGWLHSPEVMQAAVEELEAFAAEVAGEGYREVLLLGMGGSSLAPEVFRETFGVAEGRLNLTVLDSTDPGAVLEQDRRLNLAETLFIVATKSGSTVETLSFFKYFYNRALEELGEAEVGKHFIAITDPGSKLVDLARKYDFRRTFLNDPNIGGRYSALSFFGLVPAALVGVDLKRLLDSAMEAAANAQQAAGESNWAAYVGATMGELAKAGRDKITFITSPTLANFGDWVEQLIAESTGKNGTGILPVVREPVGEPVVYGNDRLFVYMRLKGESSHDEAVERLEAAGFPVIHLELENVYEMGAQMFLWEMATAVAGYRLGINPFDQPNVESAKKQARKMMDSYQETGKLPESDSEEPAAERLRAFVTQGESGDYISLQAYVEPTAETDEALTALQRHLRDSTKLPVTVGYGPRFLHSTGQLHKGDAGNGLFVQFTAEMPEDVPIPDEAGSDESSTSFGVLKTAQALGDAAALREAERRLIRFHLSKEPAAGIRNLI